MNKKTRIAFTFITTKRERGSFGIVKGNRVAFTCSISFKKLPLKQNRLLMWDCRRSSASFSWNCICRTNDCRKDWVTVPRTWFMKGFSAQGLQMEGAHWWGRGDGISWTRNVHLTVHDVLGGNWKDVSRRRRQSRFKLWRLQVIGCWGSVAECDWRKWSNACCSGQWCVHDWTFS